MYVLDVTGPCNIMSHNESGSRFVFGAFLQPDPLRILNTCHVQLSPRIPGPSWYKTDGKFPRTSM